MDRRLTLQASVVTVTLMVLGGAFGPCVFPTRADPKNFASTDFIFAEHLAQLEKSVPPGFTVVVQPPFVVIGDESPAQVRARAANTVKWAVDKLKQDYFERDPVEIIDVWLFRDQTSYTNHARLLFNDTPTTRFGYYSASHRALIMNISTGGGTLVHEIVHPFMRANFPACPAWFNEGLASLYEHAAEKSGNIRTRTQGVRSTFDLLPLIVPRPLPCPNLVNAWPPWLLPSACEPPT
jgi:hypothetical protein